jgi:hypothetical protein
MTAPSPRWWRTRELRGHNGVRGSFTYGVAA